MTIPCHCFAVDKMLGRLGTWLRLIGQDATFGSHLSGRSLIRHARAENRTILTRDHRLTRAAAGLSLIFVESDSVRPQLRQIIHACQLDPFAALFTRCTWCNTCVVAVPKTEVADMVPPYVFAIHEQFARCPCCRRIYWSGTHADRVREELHAMGYEPPAMG